MKSKSRLAAFPPDRQRGSERDQAVAARRWRSPFPTGSARVRPAVRSLGAGLVSLLFLAVAGCGSSSEPNANGLEKDHISVGVLPIPDAAPLFMAIKKGFFRAEGLTVKTEILQSSSFAVPKLRSGALDISLDNYVASFAADDQGAAHWHLIADSYQAGKGAFVVLVNPKSSIKDPKGLQGKKIAIPSLHSVGQLMITATLDTYGVEPDSVTYVEMPFPQMPAALEKKQVDAVWTPDPFISAMQKSMGARTLLDTAEPGGPTSDFPMAGWGVLDDYAQKYPKTVAAFQRAIGKAQRVAAGDRGAVAKILPTYVKGLPPDTAQLITLGAYPTTLNPIRLQRVADLMLQYGFVKKKVNVKPMIVSPPIAK
ncbi:ABC transporter substrate-binding protein [Actinomadura darangshiensis]|uniref:ABC transporter substrate-binding protein n=1 Tax=Actinomadura darangshiensis TaxID=705336 RepID=A0A4R5BIJ7_9ACTN|nr:ABC transporter substrate-binding protein [Actinomadura darangshiensis]TDD85585.1 ABC transporter substrate-binding protein [Actinomadura darangshiensis]